jgi:hypothetical protein
MLQLQIAAQQAHVPLCRAYLCTMESYVIFHKDAIFINLRAVAGEYTKKEMDSFLQEDLGLKSEDVRDIFVDPSTLLLHFTPATPALCASVLDRLFAGVRWTAFNGYPIFGWAAAEPLVTVRVTGVPRDFPAKAPRQHFESFGPISQCSRTGHLPPMESSPSIFGWDLEMSFPIM